MNNDKYNQQYRKAIELMALCDKKSEDSSLSYEEFYLNAITYEFAFSLALFNYSRFIGSSESSNSLLFLRRLLECYAYYKPFEDKRFEKINFQVYKIQAQNREVGEKEAKKIKDALKLKRCNINDAIRNNNFLFLHGIYTSDFSYRNFISEIFDRVDNEMIFLYDYFSLRAHQTNLNIFNKSFDNLDNRLFNNVKDFYPKIIIDALKNIKKLPKISLADEEKSFLSDNDDLIYRMHDELLNFYAMIEKCNIDYYTVFLGLVWSFIESSLFLFKLKSYRGIIATFKPFIEKVAVFSNLLKMKPYEADNAFFDFNFCSMYVVHNTMAKMNILEENMLENELEKLYRNRFSKGSMEGFSSFKIKIENNPSYIITRKNENYSSSVERYFTENYIKDKKELMNAYYESVVLSHCDGFLLFKKDKDYSDYAKVVIKFSLDYFRYLIDFFFGNKFHYLLENGNGKEFINHQILINLTNQIESAYFEQEEKAKVESKPFLPIENIKDYLD